MKYIEHPYFGKLNTEGLDDYDILWEENIPYKNGTVSVGFWFCGKDDLSIERLDLFEKFLKDFDAVDEKARKVLKAYLEEEPEYLNFHAEELENIPENVVLPRRKPAPPERPPAPGNSRMVPSGAGEPTGCAALQTVRCNREYAIFADLRTFRHNSQVYTLMKK